MCPKVCKRASGGGEMQEAIDALDIYCGNLEGVIDSFGGECLRITHYPLWHIPLDIAVFLGEVG